MSLDVHALLAIAQHERDQLEAENSWLREALAWILGRSMALLSFICEGAEKAHLESVCRGIINDINAALDGGE